MISEEYRYVGFDVAKSNLRKQASKVLHDIASAYDKGLLDTPEQGAIFMNLLACICEGKISGSFDEASGEIHWTLTDKYSESIAAQFEESVKENPDRATRGPWS